MEEKKVSKGKIKAFRCARTGVMFPADFVENWGRKYGLGLGPVPVSEALVNHYHEPIVSGNNEAMHPVGVCRAQVDLIEVDEEEFNRNAAILQTDDESYALRGRLMRDKQLQKSHQLRSMFPEHVEKAKVRLQAGARSYIK